MSSLCNRNVLQKQQNCSLLLSSSGSFSVYYANIWVPFNSVKTEAHRVRHWGLCWTQEPSRELQTHPMASSLFPAWGHFEGQKGRQSTKHPLTGSRSWCAHWKHPRCQEQKPRWDKEILTASREGLMKDKCVHLLFGAQIALPYDSMHYLICKGQWIAL